MGLRFSRAPNLVSCVDFNMISTIMNPYTLHAIMVNIRPDTFKTKRKC